MASPVLTTLAPRMAPLTPDLLMNIMQAFHALTKLAVQTHGGRPSDYNNPATWQCAVRAVRMQDDMDRLMREHRKHGRYRTAVAAAKMVYAMRSAAIR